MKKIINEDLPEGIAEYWGEVTDENVIEITKLPKHSWPSVLRKVANDLERIDPALKEMYSEVEMLYFGDFCRTYAADGSPIGELFRFWKSTIIHTQLPITKNDK